MVPRTFDVLGAAEEVVEYNIYPWIDFYDHGFLLIIKTLRGSMVLALGVWF
ncbi:MAG: hypothetical protein AB7T74_06910 [Clostridia bacterium]|jgi:hypothetical protein|nr:hypothetical protein [Spirochaetia bacterium]